MSSRIRRRAFGAVVGAALASSAIDLRGQIESVTQPSAGEVIERIKQQLASENVNWRASTIDTLKFGRLETKVTGIATSFMATMDVMERAVAQNLNFIISHEPTFWNHQDQTSQFAEDPVFLAKKQFAQQHDIVVWRFHDHWHARDAKPVFSALAKRLDWDPTPGRQSNYTLPPTTLRQVASDVASRLETGNVRIVGNPDMPITRVAFGSHRLSTAVDALRNSDAILMGEPREFDTFEYFRDAAELGINKGLIAISHERQEEWGMLEPCTDWISSFISEVPAIPVSAGEAYAVV